jgi:hypothetical protein
MKLLPKKLARIPEAWLFLACALFALVAVRGV